MAVYYSFHYERDVHRVQLVRNMGAVSGQTLLSAQDWEKVRRKGPGAIADWIDDQMKYKSALIVLIGQETADRTWVRYEIQRAWEVRKPMLGIRIHGLSAFGKVDSAGPDPFTNIDGHVGYNPGLPIFDPTVRDFYGRIDSKATYNELEDNLQFWAGLGHTRG
ncbi:TIR domain-containing protein [Corynebacterium pyruviciproducens]|uniref:TIR domain-containing protein n=1 Tax=Corynebacterium pyruviciproducens TaxID=598660 RepID=UPI00254A0DE0|nr:TIR domain-containing protein [Corynebacterium pyruviciproducens]MDK7214172.1 TIR domain-containing protein [Corynebacterium pyruviciproducens]